MNTATGLVVLQISYNNSTETNKKWFDEQSSIIKPNKTTVITTHAARNCDRVVIVSSTKSHIYGIPGKTIDIKDYLVVNTTENTCTESYTNQVSLGFNSTNSNIPISNDGILTLALGNTAIDIYAKNVGDNNCIKIIVETIAPVKNEEELRFALSTNIKAIEIGTDISITETGGELDIGRCVTINGNGYKITGNIKYSKCSDGAALKNIDIDGNIIIDVGNTGSVTLDNVVFDPGHSITIISGSVNSITLKGVTVAILNIYRICKVCLEKCIETGKGCTIGDINMGNSRRSAPSVNTMYRQLDEIILDAIKAEITNINIYEPSEIILAQEELPITGEYDTVVDTVTIYSNANNSDVTVNSRGLIKNVGIQADDTDTTVNTGGKIENISIDADNSSLKTNTGGEIDSIDIEGTGTSVEVAEESRIGNIYVNGDNASITGSGTAGIELGPDVHVPPSVEGCTISTTSPNIAEVSNSLGLNYALALLNIDTIDMTEGIYYTDTFEVTRSLTVRGANYRDMDENYITQTIVKRTDSKLIDVASLLEKVCPIFYVHNCQEVNISWITFDRNEKAGSAVLFNGEDSFNNGIVTDCKIIGIPGPPTGVVGLDVYYALGAVSSAQNIKFEKNIIDAGVLTSRYYDIGIGIDVNINNVDIVNNIINNFLNGIFECENNGLSRIIGNTITNCFNGMGCYKIDGSNEIRKNTLINFDKRGRGIDCRDSNNSRIIENSLTNCSEGIYSSCIDIIQIEDNNIYDNNIGLYLTSTNGNMKNNKLYDNTVALNCDTPTFTAVYNYWGTDDITAVIIQGNIIYAPYYLDEDMTILSIPITNITVKSEHDIDTIHINDSLQMYAEFQPVNATIKKVLWSTSNTTLATIDNDGLLIAKQAGIVTITAKAHDGSNISGTNNITIL